MKIEDAPDQTLPSTDPLAFHFLAIAKGDLAWDDDQARVIIEPEDREKFPIRIPEDADMVDVIEEDDGRVSLVWMNLYVCR